MYYLFSLYQLIIFEKVYWFSFISSISDSFNLVIVLNYLAVRVLLSFYKIFYTVSKYKLYAITVAYGLFKICVKN